MSPPSLPYKHLGKERERTEKYDEITGTGYWDDNREDKKEQQRRKKMRGGKSDAYREREREREKTKVVAEEKMGGR